MKHGMLHHVDFKSLLLHSLVAPAHVYPPPSESSLAPAPAGTCVKARRGQRRPAPTRSGSPDRRHPHEPETAGPAPLIAHLRASGIPTGKLLPRVRQSPRPATGTVRVSREWLAVPRRRHAGAARPGV